MNELSKRISSALYSELYENEEVVWHTVESPWRRILSIWPKLIFLLLFYIFLITMWFIELNNQYIGSGSITLLVCFTFIAACLTALAIDFIV